jgi:hypothetical protein
LSFAPPTCRMPLGQSQCIPQAYPGRWGNPRFWHRLIRFRHFCSGSLALASPNRTCRNHVPTFPQRSPPWLLATAACGGLRSTPDCRPRRTYLHLSYSYASPFGPALLVTQDPLRTFCTTDRRHRARFFRTSAEDRRCDGRSSRGSAPGQRGRTRTAGQSTRCRARELRLPCPKRRTDYDLESYPFASQGSSGGD